MKVSGLLSGGAPVIKRYQINADFANAGVPALIGGAGEAGIDLPTTTACNDMVGITLDTGTYLTAQQTDNSSPEALVSVVINPDALIEARLCGGATTGTALSANTVTTASTDGLTVTAGDYDTVTHDEGWIWGYTGANAGQARKITSVTSSAATVTVAFAYDIAVGDTFMDANISPMDVPTPTLTSDFRELNVTVAVASNTAEFAVVEIVALDSANEGSAQSYALIVARDHILNQGDA